MSKILSAHYYSLVSYQVNLRIYRFYNYYLLIEDSFVLMSPTHAIIHCMPVDYLMVALPLNLPIPPTSLSVCQECETYFFGNSFQVDLLKSFREKGSFSSPSPSFHKILGGECYTLKPVKGGGLFCQEGREIGCYCRAKLLIAGLNQLQFGSGGMQGKGELK